MAQEIKEAATFTNDLPSRSQALYSEARNLAKVHLWQEAERVASSIFDSVLRTLALQDLAKALTHAYQWQEAERIIRQMPSAENQTD